MKAALLLRIAAQLKRAAGKGLKAATIFLKARVVETVNVRPQGTWKRIKVKSGYKLKQGPGVYKIRNSAGDIIGYKAATPAIPYAPVRKVSGRLQKSIGWTMADGDTRGIIFVQARSKKGFRYDKYHELDIPGMPGSGKHKFIKPTAEKHAGELRTIMGRGVKLGWEER
jgi:hypothetical protein